MKNPKCPVCQRKMHIHGKTSSGSTRFICPVCRASMARKIDIRVRDFNKFQDWLFSYQSQAGMPGGGRTFRRRCEEFWTIWPLSPLIDEVHDVVFVDGLHLGRQCVVLIARTRDHVLGWYLSRRENSAAWQALLSRIAPPVMVVCDGGAGFMKAKRRVWPETKVQRCLFHVFCQVRRYTTSRPRLLAGKELYVLAKELLEIDDLEWAVSWMGRYNQWCTKWRVFLAEKSMHVTGQQVDAHANLVKARNSLNTLMRAKTLFTFLDPDLAQYGLLPSMNNVIESYNACLRQMLRNHRGLSLMRRVKAIMWHCYTNLEYPLPPAQILKVMPRDEQIERVMAQARIDGQYQCQDPAWGNAIQWHELHNARPYQTEWD